MSLARTRVQKSQLKAVVYVRLSSHRGDTDPSTSPARQEAACRAYCEAKGWEVVTVVSDLDVSGSEKGQRLARPGLNKIRELWGHVDIVIFAKLDRLARNVIDFRAFAEEAEEHGAALVSVAESLDLTTPGGRFVATILAAFAEMEAATIAERTSSGMRAARELGRWTGGPIPFGYQVAPHPSGQGKTLVPQASEADLVREMARRVLAGETAYAVASDLNSRGDLARGYAWRQTNVRRLLTSAPVVGRVSAGGDFLRDEAGQPRQLWEPVLALADWQALRAKFSPDSRAARKRADWLLSGLVRCVLCEGPCSAGQGQHGVRRYRCSAMANAPGSCPGVAINAEALETFVEAQALVTFGHMTTARREVVELDNGRRADIEASIAALAQQMTLPGADIPALSARLASFAAERDALPATAARQVRIVPTGLTFAEEYAAADDIAKRRTLLAEVLTVYVARGKRGQRGFNEERVTIEGVFEPYAAELESLAHEEALDAV